MDERNDEVAGPWVAGVDFNDPGCFDPCREWARMRAAEMLERAGPKVVQGELDMLAARTEELWGYLSDELSERDRRAVLVELEMTRVFVEALGRAGFVAAPVERTYESERDELLLRKKWRT